MNNLRIEINSNNDAFHPSPRMEFVGILRDIIKHISEGETQGQCCDSNGNTVGKWECRTFLDPNRT